MLTRRRVILGAGILLCLLAAGPAWLAWRLARGPIMVPWLAGQVTSAVARANDTLTVTAATASLDWDSSDRQVDLRMHSVDVRDRSQELLLRIPMLGVRLDPWALLQARVSVRELEFLQPRVTVVRLADGTFDLDFGDSAKPEEDEVVVETIMASLQIGRLEAVTLRDGTVTITNESAGTEWIASKMNLRLQAEGDGLSADFALELPMPDGPATISGTAERRPGRGVSAHVVIADLDPSALAGAPSVVRAFEVRANGELDLELDDALNLRKTTADLVLGPGTIRMPGEAADVMAVENMTIHATHANDTNSLDVEADVLTDLGLEFDLGAKLADVTGTPTGTLTGAIDELTASALAGLWPSGIAERARRWLEDRVTTGTFRKVRGQVVLAGRTIDEADLSFTVHDLQVRYQKTMPPLERGAGRGSCTMRRCTGTLTAGEVDGVAIEGSEVVVTGLDAGTPVAEVRVTANGPTGRLLTVLDHEPLGYAKRIGIDPGGVGGTVTGQATLTVPLSGTDRRPVVRAATASLADLDAPRVRGRWNVTNGALDVAYGDGVVDTSGTLRVQGVPARISWREPLGDRSVLRRVTVEAQVDRAGREAFGIDPGSWLIGPVGVKAQLDHQTTSWATLDLDLDLALTRSNLPIAALDKRPGEPGSIEAKLTLSDGRVRSVDELRGKMNVSTLTARGTRLPDGSGWETATIEAHLATPEHRDQPAKCTLDFSPSAEASRFAFAIDDLGRFLQAVGARFAVRGGALTWTGTAHLDDPARPVEGEMHVSSYVITRSLLLARIATLASISGVRKALSGKGIPIDETRVTLRHHDNDLQIEKALMVGPSLALYMAGSWDLSESTLDLAGDLAPSYFGANRALNRVPLIGDTLTGGGKGVQAVHFKARGPAGDPKVTVKKVASLAPGPLRDILKGVTP